MITFKDQEDIFILLSKNIRKDLVCYAFGGNAMMFYGYKDETKDVDLLFETEDARQEFIKALTILGYQEISPITIYVPEKLRDKYKPLMFKREDGRFDLFIKKIFKTILSPKMKEDLFAVQEYRGDFTLKVKVLRKEHLVLLKAVTDRRNDFDDIQMIIKKEKNFDWQYFMDEAIWQMKHGDAWILLDVEKMLQELKREVFIPEKYLKQLYLAKKADRS